MSRPLTDEDSFTRYDRVSDEDMKTTRRRAGIIPPCAPERRIVMGMQTRPKSSWELRAEKAEVGLSAIRALIQQCKTDAIAHRREAETIRCKAPESLRLASSCENVLAGVHEWFAHQLETLVRAGEDDGSAR